MPYSSPISNLSGNTENIHLTEDIDVKLLICTIIECLADRQTLPHISRGELCQHWEGEGQIAKHYRLALDGNLDFLLLHFMLKMIGVWGSHIVLFLGYDYRYKRI